MAVYFASSAVFIFYFLNIPVRMAFVLRIGKQTCFATGMALFSGQQALRAAIRRIRSSKKRKAKPGLNLKKAGAAFASVKHLLQRANPEYIRARGRISTGDAASTALLSGCARALEGMLPPGRIRLELEPDFSAGRSDICLWGMVSLPAGHIILAALIGARHYLARREAHGKTSD